MIIGLIILILGIMLLLTNSNSNINKKDFEIMLYNKILFLSKKVNIIKENTRPELVKKTNKIE